MRCFQKKAPETRDKIVLTTEVKPATKKQREHIVKPGDSLYKLSRKYYGTTDSWILIYNANEGNIGAGKVLYVGRRLVIPDATKVVANKKQSVKQSILSNNTIQDQKISNTYKVKPGDTLYKIAKVHYKDGSKWKKIFEANKKRLNNSSLIRVGMDLEIPQ